MNKQTEIIFTLPSRILVTIVGLATVVAGLILFLLSGWMGSPPDYAFIATTLIALHGTILIWLVRSKGKLITCYVMIAIALLATVPICYIVF